MRKCVIIVVERLCIVAYGITRSKSATAEFFLNCQIIAFKIIFERKKCHRMSHGSHEARIVFVIGHRAVSKMYWDAKTTAYDSMCLRRKLSVLY